MPRAISLSDLNALDVDGSFERMKQVALEAANGDKSKAYWDFLTGSVLKGLIEKFAAGDHDHETDNRAEAHGHDEYHQGPHDDLPPELRNHIDNIRGTDIILVMEKKITASDLKRNQNRLLFCKNSGINKLLISQEERDKVNQPRGLQVKVIQPCFETTQEVEVELKKRTKNHSRHSDFVLTGNWFKIAENEMNNLQTNDTVKLWSFRKGSELYFALVKT